MTAPVVSAPVAPAAPVVPVVATPAPQPDLQSPMEAAIQRSIARPIPTDDIGDAIVAATEPVAKPTDPQPPTDVVPQVTEGAEPAPAKDVLEIRDESPEGEVVLRARDPVTGKFSEMDQTRTYELSVKDKATGETKVYQKNLPELMRLAKDGIGTQKIQNEVRQHHDELQYYRKNAPQWEAAHTKLESDVEGFRALAIELLTLPDEEVVTRREAYAREHTPERELARQNAELSARIQTLAAKQEQDRLSSTVRQATDAFAPVVREVESLVGEDAAAGKLARSTMYLIDKALGRIPPERFAELDAYIRGPYLQWARDTAAASKVSSGEAAKLAEAARQAQLRAQAAVNEVGRTIAPLGTGQGGEGPRTPPKDFNDAVERIIHRRPPTST